ncbi:MULTISPECIES: AAA family ATPase [Brevibacterium]|uniref:ATP-binding protein n=2 Tax=Bacteria TaxID=2 RepID=A0A449D4A4_9MICO|nr:ATP-binding protein [Brevibacterium casei]NJE68185.1 ATP-binding protein [Brevibacterium sp. LS14]QPS33056.1 ATP-binding protein [Brevibacterium casei]VEW12417.1 Predicted kinase [Brevibacterium casei]
MSEHGEGTHWPGAAGQSAARLVRPPELILMVGLAGAGKSTRAAELAASLPAVRLSPDEWMRPLFGDPDPDGQRPVLEGRLIATALEILRAGTSVILDFGLWRKQERVALSWLAARVGAVARTEYLPISREMQAERIAERHRRSPETEWPVTQAELDEWREMLDEPDSAEAVGDFGARAAEDWSGWIAEKWPTAFAET